MLLRTKLEIDKWLNKYNNQDYELIADEEFGYVVNVYSNVDLSCKGLNEIKVTFNKCRNKW